MTDSPCSLKRSACLSALVHGAVLAVLALALAPHAPEKDEKLIEVQLEGGPAGGTALGAAGPAGSRAAAGSSGSGSREAAPRAREGVAQGSAREDATKVAPKASVKETAQNTAKPQAPVPALATPPQKDEPGEKAEKAHPAPQSSVPDAVKSTPAPEPPKAAAPESRPSTAPASSQGKAGEAKAPGGAGPGQAAGNAGGGSGPDGHSGEGAGNGAGKHAGTGEGGVFGSGRFLANGDGTYTALSPVGISYRILYEERPVYPKAARAIGYGRAVAVRVKLLVGLDGRVESAEVLTSGIPELGFREAALKAIRAMRFEPIVYKGRRIKMLFTKRIIFEP